MSVLVESYSWIIRSNLSQQKHLLSKMTLDKHPVQLNFKIVQHQGNHPFPGKIILMVDCSHTEKFSSYPIGMSLGVNWTHYFLPFHMTHCRKGTSIFFVGTFKYLNGVKTSPKPFLKVIQTQFFQPFLVQQASWTINWVWVKDWVKLLTIFLVILFI